MEKFDHHMLDSMLDEEVTDAVEMHTASGWRDGRNRYIYNAEVMIKEGLDGDSESPISKSLILYSEIGAEFDI